MQLVFRALRTAGCIVARLQCIAEPKMHLLARRLALVLGIQDVLCSRAVRSRHVHVVIRTQRLLQSQCSVCEGHCASLWLAIAVLQAVCMKDFCRVGSLPSMHMCVTRAEPRLQL